MNEIDDGDNCVYQALGIPDAGDMRAKSDCVMKIGLLLESGRLSKTDAAQKLGLSVEELNEIFRGKFRDLSVAKISGFLEQLKNSRG
ncbi:XRE family transcriptional regulator [Pseudomonas monachiensis]|uniref:XRE family transcriptional regulator n=1 Tax=Pseudomonas monachiensis TaxID=3060212 RepID=A0ABW9H4D3_9PSED